MGPPLHRSPSTRSASAPSSTGTLESGSSGFVADQIECEQNKNRADQVQQLTVTASAPGASDQLSFVVAQPAFIHPPTSLAITDSPIPATTGNTLTFTATLTPSGEPPPAGTISWSIDGPAPCAPTSTPVPQPPPLPTLTVTCTIANAPAGTYTPTVTYTPGSGSPYAPNTQAGPPITVYPPALVAFSTQPGGGPNGQPWSTQPVVDVEDANGDIATNNSDTVTLAIASGPSGASLTCNGGPPSMGAIGGKASFSGCQIIGPIGNYTLTASANDPVQGALTPATSTSFPVAVGAPNKLVFSTQPGDGQNGAALSTQPAVTIEDSGGNKVPASTDTITLTSTPGPPGATLTCTGGTSMAATAGVATFSDCQIVGPKGSYTLTATDAADNLTAATSDFVQPRGRILHPACVQFPAGWRTERGGLVCAAGSHVRGQRRQPDRLDRHDHARHLRIVRGQPHLQWRFGLDGRYRRGGQLQRLPDRRAGR